MWPLPISLLLAFAASSVLADHHDSSQILGFVSGSRTAADAKVKTIGDYRKEFDLATTMKDIPGKFNSVRLYTMVDEATSYGRDAVVKPNPAIKAAMDTNTRMLLGIWCSNTNDIAVELKALEAALVWGPKFADLVVGISVGHEDIYRYISEGPKSGKTLDDILEFVDKVRKAIKGTILEKKPVGHSEPWVVFANINSSFVDKLDFIGANIMPFYDEETEKVSIAKQFDKALAGVREKSRGKPVWITETGWPITGESKNGNKASVANACDFWQEIGCRRLFSKVNVWWYNLRDSNRGLVNSYAISKNLTTEPVFDLTCKKEEPKKEEPKKDRPSGVWTVSPVTSSHRVVVITLTIPDNETPSPTS
ncbi:glucan 1,3-beta-glucosidase [Colletotrichum plurivorum]|uniref:Glucan 1,3-beta-glucosidase n=1 Tax=Colletotrichum plurivorum TaxID=2175906 RepID=A0A8H6JRL6_9PEZI|nr:glucan 1,3-beta-glucosidase [Colletotrichum plurivorum]